MITEEGNYYVYRHIRLDRNEPFYIGIAGKQANNGGYYRANRTSNRNYLWEYVYNATDKNIKIDILCESDDFEFIKKKEQEFIALYGRKNTKTGTLTNLTDGGDGTIGAVYSEERRKKQSEILKNSPHNLKGKKLPDWWVDKIRQSKIGSRNPQFGKHTAVSKKVINVLTEEVFPTILLAGASVGLKGRLLHQYLSGHRINKSPFVYLSTFMELGVDECLKLINQPPRIMRGNSKAVIDTDTGKEFASIAEASDYIGIEVIRLRRMISGKIKNTTSLKYKNG